MIAEADPGARLEPRTNMFLIATISASSFSGPVKVRNLSPSGALIEGAALLAVKEPIHLRRGRLAVTGEVVWSRSGRAGLRFRSRLKVKDWLPTDFNRAAQQRVDEILQSLRADATGDAPPRINELPEVHALSASDLGDLAKAIDALAQDLASDQVVVSRHFTKLQTLDIAAQALRKLSAAATCNPRST